MNNNNNTNGAELSGKHAKNLLRIFKLGLMIPEFYESLFTKFDNNEKNVLDIKRKFDAIISKHFDQTNTTNADKICAVNMLFVHTLEHYPARGIKHIKRVYDMSSTLINTLLDNDYSDYDSFIVFGCPESTDIDVVCFVRKQDVRLESNTVKDLSSVAFNRLVTELKQLGYNDKYVLPKDVDVNAVYVDPETQMIVAALKGGKDTQNMINATWMHHRQVMADKAETIFGKNEPLALSLHPMCDISFDNTYIFTKIKTFAKFVIDYAEDVCIDHIDELKSMRHDMYTVKTIQFILDIQAQIMNRICYDPETIPFNSISISKWHDRFKSIIMKLIQLCLIIKHNITVYVKMDLAESVKLIFKDTPNSILDYYVKGAEWYLFRGNRGVYFKDLFPALLNEYNEITKDFLQVNSILQDSLL